jgi:predicted TIM-barrel fold metal-dependent hydrolase
LSEEGGTVFVSERIVFGTGYGAVPISPDEHVEIVRSIGLTKDDEEKIFWRNANDLFGLGSESRPDSTSATSPFPSVLPRT